MDEPAGRADPVVARETRYDSFQVRLWSREGSADLLRLEIRHLQTGSVDTATGVSLATLVDIVSAALCREAPPMHG